MRCLFFRSDNKQPLCFPIMFYWLDFIGEKEFSILSNQVTKAKKAWVAAAVAAAIAVAFQLLSTLAVNINNIDAFLFLASYNSKMRSECGFLR